MIEALMRDKKKLAIYGGLLAVCVLALAYVTLSGGGDSASPQLNEAEKRAAELEKSMQPGEEQAPPELPIEKRSPRGMAPAK